MAQVILKKIRKRYQGAKADTVKETDLEIKDQEFMVLVGPSGCGKSTTLRMIAGLEDITAGEIQIGTRVVNDLHPKDRDIAMVFQNYALYPHMSIYENLAFGLKLRGVPTVEIDKRVQEASNTLGLSQVLDGKPKALSGGQRQRVALGRAIVREPQVFLMDEPLSNLDAKLRVQMRAEINKLHKRLKATIVYVTHDQVEAMTMADRIAILNDGYVQQCDTPQVVYDKPANKFVAGFIGSPSMNFASVRVTKGELVGQSFGITLPSPRRDGLMPYEGIELEIGFRPEHIYPVAPGVSTPAGAAVLDATIDVVEPMGAENYVYLKVGDQTFIARFPPHVPLTYGAPIKIAVDTAKVHLFDKATGLAISLN